MSATIKDVAREANVSVSTVSRVLREEGYFSEESKNKVLKASKKLNYRVNSIGKSLRSKHTKVLGHISRSGGLHFFPAEIVKGIDEQAYNKGYHVIVSNTSGDEKLEREQINTLLERRVDGIIIANPTSIKNYEYLKKQNTPFVMIENNFGLEGIDKVVIDNKKATKIAGNYLFEKGHKNILFAGRSLKFGVARSRFEGYKAAFEEKGYQLNNDYILLAEEYTFEDGKKLFAEYFHKNKQEATAIIVTTDMMLLAVMQTLYICNIKVPDDISIIGLNDLLAPYLSPPVTSIVQPVEEMGKAAVDLLLNRIRDSERTPTTITMGTKLSERDTVKDIS